MPLVDEGARLSEHPAKIGICISVSARNVIASASVGTRSLGWHALAPHRPMPSRRPHWGTVSKRNRQPVRLTNNKTTPGCSLWPPKSQINAVEHQRKRETERRQAVSRKDSSDVRTFGRRTPRDGPVGKKETHPPRRQRHRHRDHGKLLQRSHSQSRGGYRRCCCTPSNPPLPARSPKSVKASNAVGFRRRRCRQSFTARANTAVAHKLGCTLACKDTSTWNPSPNTCTAPSALPGGSSRGARWLGTKPRAAGHEDARISVHSLSPISAHRYPPHPP